MADYDVITGAAPADSDNDDVFVFPLSFAQRRLWLIDRLAPGNPAYNVPAAVRFRGPFDPAAFEDAVNIVVARHESLRTNILVIEGEPAQAVAGARRIAASRVDLSGSADVESAVHQQVREEGLRPFDLASDALIRAVVYRLGAQDHVVQLTVHHIVSDGWSIGVLVGEISQAYAALRQGRTPVLPALEIQYGDYAEWQRDWLTGEVLERQLAYWRSELAAPLPTLALLTDRPRPAIQTFRGASVPFRIAAVEAAALAGLARGESATLFMAVLAVFTSVLFRYTGQTDLIVGSPIANRGRRELEPLIGFFVNTLVLRSALSSTTTFRELLRQVRQTTLDAYAHQDLPFEHLVEALQPDRSMSHTPFFQVLFALQNTPAIPAAVADAQVSSLELEASTAKFDLSVSLTETDAGLVGAAEFNTDLFDRSTIERLTTHFARLLDAVVAQPDLPIARQPFLTDTDRRCLAAWNDTEQEIPGPDTIHGLIEAQAAAAPGNMAVLFELDILTYGELNRRANQLAHYLRRQGVGAETVVAVCLERSLDLIVSLVAVMKAGAAYLPLDPTYPRERLRFMLEDGSASMVVTWRALADSLGLAPHHLLCLDELRPVIDLAPSGNPGAAVDGSNAAYVIFTSGSTGRPKGAVNTHAAIVNRLRWMHAEYGLTADDRVLQKTPFGFDVSVWELFSPLTNGACLIVAKPGGHKDPAYLTDLIDAERITTAHFVPSMLRAFLDAPGDSTCPSLTRVFCSGEALPGDVQQAFLDRFGAELSNLYGPTETAVEVSYWRCRRDDHQAIVFIGKPIANTRIHIVDDELAEAPVGVAGELLIGGVQVARGYVGRPDLTAERFVPDPFGAPGSRLYRSGDRGRWLDSGEIQFLGRFDFQIKIRGFRVEAGEIEARLLEHASVGAALVVAREDRPGDVRLVAYVVPAPGAGLDVAVLRQHVGGSLPDYMVPAAFVILASLPLLTSGKLDRSALPEPTWGDGAERTDVAPRTSTEDVLLGIWRELLGVGQFGVEDNFFALGGHSLLATQVVSRIAELFQIELPLRTIFERTTVSALAAHLDELRQKSAGVVAPAITPVPRGGPLRLSFAQQRLWFLNQIDGTSTAYNMPAALRIEGRLDIEVLERTLGELLRRHEVLRSRFVVEDGVPVTIIDPEPRFTLAIDDLRNLPPVERELAATTRAAAEFEQPFDLAAGPLVRSRLLQLEPDNHVLLLTAHHIVSDGWSTALLVEDLMAAYGAFLHGLPSPLPPLLVQYADFAEWQRTWLSGTVLEAQLEYWKRQLAGAPARLQLPTDRPRPAIQSFDGATTTFALGPDLAEGVKQLSAHTGSTTFMTMLAAFLLLLSRYTRQQDVVVGSPMAGRARKELEPLVGFFLNTLVIRGDLSGDPTFHELVERIRHVVLDAYAHQDVPFEQIVEALQPDRSTSVTPLFQVVFSGAMTHATPIALPDVRVTPLPPARVAAKFDLTVGFGEGDTDITGSFEYNTALFDHKSMVDMAAHYRTLLAAVVRTPDARISTLSLASHEERRAALAAAQGPAPDGPPPARTGNVATAIAAVAARQPSAIALRDATRQLTYAQLESRANGLAHRLLATGLAPEARVAVCVERSVDLVVALLAVFKAGAAYVPLDSSYPSERLRFMVENSGASVLLASPAIAGNPALVSAGVVVLDVSDGAERDDAPVITVDADALAYVIYTSGSTGAPKGVEVSHAAVLNLVEWHVCAFGLTASDRCSQVASLAFDAAAWEIWPCLAAGAALHIAADMTVRSPAALVRWLTDRQVTVSFIPTPLAEQALRADWRGASLRFLLTGGDTLHLWAPEDLPFTLVNNYGPTENTVVSSSGAASASGRTGQLPTIGRPIAGTRIYLVDEQLELVPAGVPGEMLVGGRSLARGYHQRPDMTAERFVPNPFSSEAGARLYRTGDLARWHADGTLDFLGRIDRQVKLRGVRLELGEIEAVLARHPDVAQAAALVRGAGAELTLLAYVSCHGPATPEGLRAYLREQLPEYSVPSAIVVLDSLPLTGSGKVDTRALAALPLEPLRAPAELPRTESERLVARVWAEVLGVAAVGAHDNFFDVGGHSLKLIDVHARLQTALGRDLSIVDLFRYPTVSGLAAFLTPAATASTEDSVLSAAELRARKQRGALQIR